jgi:hypothetical protein
MSESSENIPLLNATSSSIPDVETSAGSTFTRCKKPSTGTSEGQGPHPSTSSATDHSFTDQSDSAVLNETPETERIQTSEAEQKTFLQKMLRPFKKTKKRSADEPDQESNNLINENIL